MQSACSTVPPDRAIWREELNLFLIAAQNNAIRTNYIKTEFENTQLNSKCTLRGNRNEMVNQIISPYSKLAQKEYKTRPDRVGKMMIHWELCTKKTQRSEKGTGGNGDHWKNWDYLDDNTDKNSLNTQKNPGNMRWPAQSFILQFKLVWKTPIEGK